MCDLFGQKVAMERVFEAPSGLVRISFLLRPSFVSCFLLIVNGLVVGIARSGTCNALRILSIKPTLECKVVLFFTLCFGHLISGSQRSKN